jgi:hypothetical protein
MRSRRKTILQATLLLTGLWLLIGCIYIPRFGKSRLYNYQNAGPLAPDELIGTPKDQRPITLGLSTRADVDSALARARAEHGQPLTLRWSDDRRYAFCSYRVVSGYMVLPLCLFATEPVPDNRVLRLTFDPDGRLHAYRVFDDLETAVRGTSVENQPPLTDQDRRLLAKRQATTRDQSATRP